MTFSAACTNNAVLLQDDNFIPAMTARETLAFYADITLTAPKSMARSKRIEEVLAAMGLAAAAHTMLSGL
jgi:ABC-type multidrug transport system ATPase subunit